uniref:ABC transporter domain-containing protein n=1 Tax=Rhabditophanes sp. KR3021 TaxID=114890 RepID=A0AC35TL38_9BILA
MSSSSIADREIEELIPNRIVEDTTHTFVKYIENGKKDYNLYPIAKIYVFPDKPIYYEKLDETVFAIGRSKSMCVVPPEFTLYFLNNVVIQESLSVVVGFIEDDDIINAVRDLLDRSGILNLVFDCTSLLKSQGIYDAFLKGECDIHRIPHHIAVHSMSSLHAYKKSKVYKSLAFHSKFQNSLYTSFISTYKHKSNQTYQLEFEEDKEIMAGIISQHSALNQIYGDTNRLTFPSIFYDWTGGAAVKYVAAHELLHVDDDNESNRVDDDEETLLGEEIVLVTDEECSWFSKLFFTWTTGLIEKGYKRQLDSVDDLFQLPNSLNVDMIHKTFAENTKKRSEEEKSISLFGALYKSFGVEFFVLAIPRICADITSFAGPLLLSMLIIATQANDVNGMIKYSFFILVASSISVFNNVQYNFYVNKVAMKIKTATTMLIYDKIFVVKKFVLKDYSSGQIANFISIDTDRISNFCNSFHSFWSMPFQFIVALALIYREVGWAFVAILIISAFMIPLNKFISVKIGELSTGMMRLKDERMKLLSETMKGIKCVKLCGWDEQFEAKINLIRTEELSFLKKRKYLDAMCVYLWASCPVLITISIFGTYTLIMEQVLTASKVFTCLALINMLITPLNAFPWVLNGVIESYVSLKRLSQFADLQPSLPGDSYHVSSNSPYAVQVEDASFVYSIDTDVPTIKSISFKLEKGKIIGVMGPINAGKTTLLLTVLGELNNCKEEEKSITVDPSFVGTPIGYIGHDSWLIRGTVKENILCGKAYDEEDYRAAVKGACLTEDIANFPGHDDYFITDGGATISGGQRVRMMMARAIYQNCSLFLLDSPMAALDNRTARHVWKSFIVNEIRAKGKSAIIASHNLEFLKKCDHLIVLNNIGQLIRQGPASELFKEKIESEVVLDEDNSLSKSDLEEPEFVIPTDPVDDKEISQKGRVRLHIYKEYINAAGYILSGAIIISIFAMQITKNGSEAWLGEWTAKNDPNGTSTVNFSHGKDAYTEDEWETTKYYFKIYVIVAFLNTLFTLMRSFLFAYGGIVATSNLHSHLLKCVISAKLEWWDKTPWGVVVNRLCSDVFTVDDSLPFQLNIFLASVFNLMGSMILSLYALPILLPFVILTGILYYGLQYYYRFTTCEVKRLTTTTLSPIFSHVNDTFNGTITIKAFKLVSDFTEIMKKRITNNLRAQYSNLASSQWLSVRLQIMGVIMIAAVAFASILQKHFGLFDTSLVGLAITYALSMTNLLNSILNSFIETEKEMVSVERISHFIQNVPREVDFDDSFGEMDLSRNQADRTRLDSRQTISRLVKLGYLESSGSPQSSNQQSEGSAAPSPNGVFKAHKLPSPDINASGTVVHLNTNPELATIRTQTPSNEILFERVSLKYNSTNHQALDDVSFAVNSGKKIAVCGRTGSGKSSLFGAILKAYSIDKGRIIIGGINIRDLKFSELRQSIATITQDPFIFAGTIRSNLKVGVNKNLTDQEIKEFFEGSDTLNILCALNGLNFMIADNGSNISAGQKQVIALARVILARPKILLIDEGTSQLDNDLHSKMIKNIADYLPETTVLMVIHNECNFSSFDGIIHMESSKIRKLTQHTVHTFLYP